MANVRLRWILPSVRQNGRPLDVSSIAGTEIAISANGGADFTVTDVVPSPVTELVINELEPGTWVFRGVVLDSAGRRSNPSVAEITIEDDSPPGDFLLEVELA